MFYFVWLLFYIFYWESADRQLYYQKMSSPSRYRNTSPVKNLEERFYSKPLDVILEENNAYRLSNSLIYQNQVLEKENQLLVHAVARSKDEGSHQFAQNVRVKQEKENLQKNFRNLEAVSAAQKHAKDKQIESQQRDIRLLKEQYARQNQGLRDQIHSLSNKINLIETQKKEQLDSIKRRCLNATAEQTQFLRKNLSDELRKVVSELELTRQLLSQKEKQNQHLIVLSQQRSDEYTINLENMISENNILRNRLFSLENEKNKEIQQAEHKKELEKSRTIGILEYCKENNQFKEKQIGRLAEQLLEKNISIQSFTKELLKLRKTAEMNERKFEETMAKQKVEFEDILKEKERETNKLEQYHKQDIMSLKQSESDLQEKLATCLNDLDNLQRELSHVKEQGRIKDKEIEELKDNISRMHQDHSKELSKVMIDSRVKRKSGLNISYYSSSSLKDIDDAQGSSIIRAGSIERKNSNELSGPGGLPVVKEELAVSQGHLDEEVDIEIRELIQHYSAMIEELKKSKANELLIASQKIDNLKYNLNQKQEELVEALNRFEPLLELQRNRPNIEEERRVKIEQSQKTNVAILEVLLDKYGIVSLKPKNR